MHAAVKRTAQRAAAAGPLPRTTARLPRGLERRAGHQARAHHSPLHKRADRRRGIVLLCTGLPVFHALLSRDGGPTPRHAGLSPVLGAGDAGVGSRWRVTMSALVERAAARACCAGGAAASPSPSSSSRPVCRASASANPLETAFSTSALCSISAANCGCRDPRSGVGVAPRRPRADSARHARAPCPPGPLAWPGRRGPRRCSTSGPSQPSGGGGRAAARRARRTADGRQGPSPANEPRSPFSRSAVLRLP